MAKKKRSAKQLANDKRLGRMAKKRAAAKRKKNPARKKRRATRKKKVMRARPAKRSTKAKKTRTTAYVIFKCVGKAVSYLYLTTAGKKQWTTNRMKALHWTNSKDALGIAKRVRGATGVAGSNQSKTEIARQCAGKA